MWHVAPMYLNDPYVGVVRRSSDRYTSKAGYGYVSMWVRVPAIAGNMSLRF